MSPRPPSRHAATYDPRLDAEFDDEPPVSAIDDLPHDGWLIALFAFLIVFGAIKGLGL